MMSKINQTDIDRLIELVGGRGNIATVSHCITRLRFVLNQPANARPKEIEQLPMVKGCFTNAGQFQVVIGTNVGDYYQALIASTGQAQVDKEQVKKAARQNMKWHEQLISHFAEIFFPLLPALISGGLILGFLQCDRRFAHEQRSDAGANVPFPANDLRFSVVDR